LSKAIIPIYIGLPYNRSKDASNTVTLSLSLSLSLSLTLSLSLSPAIRSLIKGTALFRAVYGPSL
jgi:hypothetical protein